MICLIFRLSFPPDVATMESIRPQPHMIFCMKMHTFDAFLPIIHTKATENADENGGFQKRFQKWWL